LLSELRSYRFVAGIIAVISDTCHSPKGALPRVRTVIGRGSSGLPRVGIVLGRESRGSRYCLGKAIEVHWFDTGHGGSLAQVALAIEHQEVMLRFAKRIITSLVSPS
jgi:hypothetical protein